MMDNAIIKQIPVSIDKSHLVTIGEKMYGEKIDLIRELVNNAYDADATEVHITLADNRLTVRDNGSGMDEAGLRTYFTIGSQNKKSQPLSDRFKRHRIGEFGIGKFAALSACKIFQVETQRGSFHARLVFDKESWQHHEDWHIDIAVLPYDPDWTHGTQVTLIDMHHQFSLTRIRRYLRERIPLQTKQFVVWLNGERLEEDVFVGRQQTFKLTTPYGGVTGTLVLTNTAWTSDDAGIGIYVKNVLVTKETFGLELTKKLGATRLRGKVYADFLPVTSSRDSIIRDSAEYAAFREIVSKEIQKLLKVAKTLADRRADQRSSHVLREAMGKIGKALRKHDYLHLGTDLPMGETVSPDAEATTAATEAGYDVSAAQFTQSGADLPPEIQQRLDQNKQTKRRGRPSAMLGQKSIIRKLHLQNLEIAVRLEHLQDDEESLLSSGVIYINLDHPLYHLYHNDEPLLTYHVARLITKELALQAMSQSATDAFHLQSELLTEAFRSTRKELR